MIKIKSVIHDIVTNSIEVTWVERIDGEVTDTPIRCQSYADVQMDMLSNDLGENAVDYSELISLVESKIKPVTQPKVEELITLYSNALAEHHDTVAQSKRYDNRITCALRAGYKGPFRTECTAFAIWMDTCNAQGYALLAEVQSGKTPMPTIPEFIASMPEMVWP